MVKRAVVIAVIMGFIGCTHVLVKQFVDVDEMMLLAPKMKKNTVLQYLGSPIEARGGILLKDSTVVEVWLYNVKEKRAMIPVSKRKEKPPKTFKASYWAAEKTYALIFVNADLVKWGYYEDVWPQFEKYGDICLPKTVERASESGGNPVEKVEKKGRFLGIF